MRRDYEPVKDTGHARERRQVRTSELRRLADAVSALERPVVHGPHTAIRTSILGMEITSRGLPFWARITGHGTDGNGTTCYAWSELFDSGDGTFTVLDNGRSGTTTDNQAYEVSRSPTVLSGTVAIMWLSYSQIVYEFKGPCCQVLKIATASPSGGFFDTLLEIPSGSGTWTDGPSIYALDLSGASKLTAGDRYQCHYIGATGGRDLYVFRSSQGTTTYNDPVTFKGNVTFTGPLTLSFTDVTLVGSLSFPASTSVSVAPTALLILPTLLVGAAIGQGPPTWSDTVGSVVCDGKYLWQNGGTTDWYGYVPFKGDGTFATQVAISGGIPYLTATGVLTTTPELIRDPSTGYLFLTGLKSTVTNAASGTPTITQTFIRTSSSGTPTTGYGMTKIYQMDSDSVPKRTVLTEDLIWITVADASRKPRYVISLTDSGGTWEMIRFDTDGSTGLTSFGGATLTSIGHLIRSPGASYQPFVIRSAASPSANQWAIQDSSGTTQVAVDRYFTLHLTASTTDGPSLNVPVGTAPTSPADGDWWYDGTHLYFQTGASLKDLLAGGGGGSVGGSDTQLLYNASGVETGDSNLVWDYTNQTLTITAASGLFGVIINNGTVISSINNGTTCFEASGGPVFLNNNTWPGGTPANGTLGYDGTHLYFQNGGAARDLLAGASIGGAIGGGPTSGALLAVSAGNLTEVVPGTLGFALISNGAGSTPAFAALNTLLYSPGNAGDWNGSPPTSSAEALDRCAALLKVLNGGTGP